MSLSAAAKLHARPSAHTLPGTTRCRHSVPVCYAHPSSRLTGRPSAPHLPLPSPLQMASLSMVWLSHKHPDHVLGLARLLEARAEQQHQKQQQHGQGQGQQQGGSHRPQPLLVVGPQVRASYIAALHDLVMPGSLLGLLPIEHLYRKHVSCRIVLVWGEGGVPRFLVRRVTFALRAALRTASPDISAPMPSNAPPRPCPTGGRRLASPCGAPPPHVELRLRALPPVQG